MSEENPYQAPAPTSPARKPSPISRKSIAAVVITWVGLACFANLWFPFVQLHGWASFAVAAMSLFWLPIALVFFGLERRKHIRFRFFIRAHFWIAVVIGGLLILIFLLGLMLSALRS